MLASSLFDTSNRRKEKDISIIADIIYSRHQRVNKWFGNGCESRHHEAR